MLLPWRLENDGCWLPNVSHISITEPAKVFREYPPASGMTLKRPGYDNSKIMHFADPGGSHFPPKVKQILIEKYNT